MNERVANAWGRLHSDVKAPFGSFVTANKFSVEPPSNMEGAFIYLQWSYPSLAEM